MKLASPAPTAALFGKLPCSLDFVRVSHDSAESIALDRWLQAALQRLAARKQPWPIGQLTFAFALDAQHGVVGVTADSCDRAGRRFPVAVYARVPRPSRVPCGTAALMLASGRFIEGARALLALGAELSLASASGRRRLPLSEFFTGYRQTALSHGELIECVHLPRPLPRLQRFYKVSKRAMDDISSVAAAMTLELDAAGRVERSTFAYGGIAAVPLRAFELERLAVGRPWNAETVAELVNAARQLGTPLSDHRASADYRRAMLGSLIERFQVDTSRAGEAVA